jgi:hypothetical protein
LDSGRQEVFALFRGQGNQENGRRHQRILQILD